jgi:hypothetical protein
MTNNIGHHGESKEFECACGKQVHIFYGYNIRLHRASGKTKCGCGYWLSCDENGDYLTITPDEPKGEILKLNTLNDLRFVEKDGRQVLQQLCEKQDLRYDIYFTEWEDVPTVKEE